MDADARAFFEQVLETPSPSGYESPLQQLVRGYAQQFADEVLTDVHGNVIAVRNAGASRRVMLAGHCDQIGLYVQYVDTEGFVYVQALGGWDTQILLGQRMTVWGRQGPVTGVIARKAIHLLTEDEKKQVPKLKDMWLDIGCKSREDAEGLVRVGDPITLELVSRELRNGLMASPAMDDKCGMWVVLEALRRVDAGRLQWAVYAVSTVQEEVGLRGAKTSAYGIDPEVGIAVDVTHATDSPTMDKKQDGDVALGRGPVVYRGPNMNPKLVERLIEAAGTHQIPYQLGASGRPPGTDANVIQLSRAGVATGLVSIPNRYMHSPVEVISLEDIDRAADLLARTIEDLPGDFDFTP